MAEQKKQPLLSVEDLHTYFYTDAGVAKAVDGVSWSIEPGETLGLVGESGCGKSVSSFSVLRLVDAPGRIVSGNIFFKGRDLLSLRKREMRHIRGREISMIFQEPMTSLNPVFTVGDQIIEAIMLHQRKTYDRARKLAIEMLGRVGIPDAERRVDEYPHQMSGGMKQRVMIAMALVCRPDLLIADEPTTALDVTIQAEILDLLKDLQAELNMAILLITHNLGLVADMAERVAVMYAGKIVECAPTEELFENPKHPYTMCLFKSIPRLTDAKDKRLEAISGQVPNPTNWPTGCRFHPRCPYATQKCRELAPALKDKSPGHAAACWVIE